MNSGSLGKARRRAVRKVGFLIVLMLVTLAYAVTPLTAFACDGNNNNNNGGQKNKGNPIAASDKQVRDDLNGGSKIASLKIKNKVVQLADIKPPDIFDINFADGVSVKNVRCLAAGAAPVALVTLPVSKKLVEFRPLAAPGKIVTDVVDPKSVANGSKEASLFQNSSSSDWLLFRLDGSTPLDRSAIKKTLQSFKIQKIGSSILMKAVYLGSGKVGQNLVLVTPPNKQPMSIPLSDL